MALGGRRWGARPHSGCNCRFALSQLLFPPVLSLTQGAFLPCNLPARPPSPAQLPKLLPQVFYPGVQSLEKTQELAPIPENQHSLSRKPLPPAGGHLWVKPTHTCFTGREECQFPQAGRKSV